MSSPQETTRNPMFAFLSLSLLLSWPVFFLVDGWLYPGLLEAGKSTPALFLLLAGHLVGMFGPGIAALILSRRVLEQPFPIWVPGRLKYYLWGFLFMAAVWLLPALLGSPFSTYRLRGSIESFQWVYLGVYMATGFFAATAEETGWSAFLLTYLGPRYGKSRALLISGTYRGIWHYPILISPFIPRTLKGDFSPLWFVALSVAFMIQLVVSNILFGSLFGYVWYRTRSLPLLGWLHFIFDMARDFSMFFIIGYGSGLFGRFGWAVLFYPIAFLCLLRVMHREGINSVRGLLSESGRRG